MASIDTNNFILSNNEYSVYISGYYALYNSTIDCRALGDTYLSRHARTKCNITCTDNNFQFFHVKCNTTWHGSDCNNTIVNNCTMYNQTTDDNITLTFIEELRNIDIVLNSLETICNDDNSSATYNIGYPLFADINIENDIEYGYICCLGYRSCSVCFSNIRHIFLYPTTVKPSFESSFLQKKKGFYTSKFALF